MALKIVYCLLISSWDSGFNYDEQLCLDTILQSILIPYVLDRYHFVCRKLVDILYCEYDLKGCLSSLRVNRIYEFEIQTLKVKGLHLQK